MQPSNFSASSCKCRLQFQHKFLRYWPQTDSSLGTTANSSWSSGCVLSATSQPHAQLPPPDISLSRVSCRHKGFAMSGTSVQPWASLLVRGKRERTDPAGIQIVKELLTEVPHSKGTCKSLFKDLINLPLSGEEKWSLFGTGAQSHSSCVEPHLAHTIGLTG
jgi:hypothetical protein